MNVYIKADYVTKRGVTKVMTKQVF